jgi:hypothetical protein
MDGFRAFYASDNYRDVIKPDEERFVFLVASQGRFLARPAL